MQNANASDAAQQQNMVNGDIVANQAQQQTQQAQVPTQGQAQQNLNAPYDVSLKDWRKERWGM